MRAKRATPSKEALPVFSSGRIKESEEQVRMKFSSVIIFGEALVDLFKTGLVVGGAPFNVARHLAGFGFNSLFISAIGQDNVGMLIKQEN